MIKELRDKRNRLMQQAQQIQLQESITPEERNQFAVMMTDVDAIDEVIRREEAEAAESRSHVAPPRANPGEVVNDPDETVEVRTKKQKAAFRHFLQFGETRLTAEQRSHLEYNLQADREIRDLGVGAVGGAITGGAQFVPQAFYPELTEAQLAWGGLLNLVNTRITDSGAPMNVALANDTGNGLTVVGEPATLVETDPALSSTLLSTSMVTTGVIKVTLQELQDSAFDIDDFIKNNFGRRYYRGSNNLITNGGTNIQSVIAAAAAGATSLSGIGVGYDDLVKTYSALDPAYLETATWTMGSSTRSALMGVKDTLGRPIFIPSPSSGAFDTLFGRPVVLNQALAAIPTAPAANKVPVQFGDFKQGYLFRKVKGDLTIVRLAERYMDTLEVGFIGYARIGGIGTDAGTHPIVNLTLKAS